MWKKIGSSLDTFWNWLVRSSTNESNISLTVKGFSATAISYIIGVVGALHLQIPGLSENLDGIADNIVLFIQYGLGIVGVISFIVGGVRKLWLSIFTTKISTTTTTS